MKRVVVLFALAAALVVPQAAQAEFVYGLTTANQLFSFETETPQTLSSFVSISGLRSPNEQIVGIDFRPATPGQLVGVGNLGGQGAVYLIDKRTGAATMINSGFALNGSAFGVDFNPVPNALRIVSNTGQNLRITVGGGGVVNVDGNLNPGSPSVGGAAYANNFAGTTTTTLYDIDSGSDRLFIQSPPNDGTLVDVGALGVNTTDLIAFDISGNTGIAYASLTPVGGSGSQLYQINLATGAATLLGNLGGGTLGVRGLSVDPTVPEPASLTLFGLGVVSLVGYGWRRKKAA